MTVSKVKISLVSILFTGKQDLGELSAVSCSQHFLVISQVKFFEIRSGNFRRKLTILKFFKLKLVIIEH